MAQTINGIIAREDYKEDFLSDKNWDAFVKLVEKIGCFIIGRKTYEEVKKLDDYNYEDIDSKKIVVSDKQIKLDKNYVLANSPKDALKKASDMGFKEIIVTGGSTLNASFIKENLIDEIILNVEPVILGMGIKLFREGNFESKLKFIDSKKISKDIIQLHYKVLK